ncbi:MAG: hypothetical protein MJZ41_01550 [Bacteroidaceae bacterium]|nr:hypothetical protein [Bacteroidaceae bacterium]
MKKFFITVMALAAISFTACKNEAPATDSEAEGTEVVEGAEVEAVEIPVEEVQAAIESGDEESAQKALTAVQAYAEKLTKEGKVEEANTYLLKIQEFIANNESTVNEVASGNATISSLISTIKSIPSKANEGADAAKEDAKTLKEKANDAVNAAKEDAKTKANDAVNKATEDAKAKANEKIDETTNKAKDAIKNKLGI